MKKNNKISKIFETFDSDHSHCIRNKLSTFSGQPVYCKKNQTKISRGQRVKNVIPFQGIKRQNPNYVNIDLILINIFIIVTVISGVIDNFISDLIID